MNLGNIGSALTRVGHRGLLISKKYAPQALTAAGIVGGITTTVLASKATLKLPEILKDHNEYRNVIDITAEKYTDAEVKKDIAHLYFRTSVKLLKLYGPALTVGGASVVAVVSGQGIMQQRNAAITAAYIGLDKAFDEYRKKVEKQFGADLERTLRFDLEEELDTDKNGKQNGTRLVATDSSAPSMYARFFDETSSSWVNNPEYNRNFLTSVQNYANDMLRARGHVFLNEVYDRLGIERSKEGAVVGWLWNGDGDSYIDFGIFDGDREAVRRFVNGQEAAILLDFNVDGTIFDKI